MATEVARRVDWRLLLADPAPRRTVVVGGDATWQDQTVEALAIVGLEARTASSEADLDATVAGADLVVARLDGSVSPDALDRSLPAPTSLVLESVSPLSRWPSLARPHTRIVAWPRLGAASELVPVRSPDSRHLFAERRARRGGMRARLPGVAIRLPWPHPIGRMVIATDGGAASALLALAGRHTVSAEREAAAPWTLITPTFRASRHLVLLLGTRLVLKVEREAGARSVDHEATVLRAAARHRGAEVPRVIAVDEAGPYRVLLETAVPGLDLTPRRARRDPAAYADMVATWLRELTGSPAPFTGAWRQEILDAPAAVLRALGTAAIDHVLLDRATEAMHRLSDRMLIGAIEHGDLGDPNLRLNVDGTLGVIDWELGRVDGVALLDLVFAIAYFAGAEARARDVTAHADAWEAIALQPHGWGHALLRREAAAIGLDPRLISGLTVLCWVRQLARLAQRVGNVPTAVATVRGHRYLAILRRSIEGLA